MQEDEARPELKIAVRLDEPGDIGAWLADAVAFESAGADELWIDSPAADDSLVLTAALAALTYRSLLVTAAPPSETLERLARGRLRYAPDEGVSDDEQWHEVAVPENRAAWRAALAEARELRRCGVIVPADPRLVDMLRNPEDPGERHDLYLAQG